eukprot:363999-Chlamydomonas_euryale.AAC.12
MDGSSLSASPHAVINAVKLVLNLHLVKQLITQQVCGPVRVVSHPPVIRWEPLCGRLRCRHFHNNATHVDPTCEGFDPPSSAGGLQEEWKIKVKKRYEELQVSFLTPVELFTPWCVWRRACSCVVLSGNS